MVFQRWLQMSGGSPFREPAQNYQFPERVAAEIVSTGIRVA